MGKRKKRTHAKNYTPLDKHERKGKLLVPPFMSIPNLKPISWLNDRLPEMLWAALLVTGLERGEALDVFRRAAMVFHGSANDVIADVSLTGIAALPPNVREQLLKVLCSTSRCKTALRPLLLFQELPGYSDWAQALAVEPCEEDWEALKFAVGRTLDHQSQEATDCRWMSVLARMIAGQLKLPSVELVKEVLHYPQYGDMRAVRPFIRSTEAALATATENGDTKDGWAPTFWRRCWEETPCETLLGSRPGPIRVATTVDQLKTVRVRLAEHYLRTVTTTDIDASHEGTFGMAGYSLAILSELLRIGNGTSILGRMGLRALLECYVTLAYLVAVETVSPDSWMAYRNYGAGQAKLAFLKLDDASVEAPMYVSLDTLKAVANEDRWMEFREVNIGHWDNTNLRGMSEKAGVKHEYDRYYPWTSGFVHGNWAAVRNSVFDVCMNPLHRLHRVLLSDTHSLEDVVPDACTIVDKILEIVDRKYPEFPHRVSL